LKRTYKLSEIIKAIKSVVKAPNSKVLINTLKGTDFDNGNLSVSSEFDYKTSNQIKSFLKEVIKQKNKVKKEKQKGEKVYFYVYIGGTPELKNRFKINISDHPITKVIVPAGCDKYCTENQYGKPTNWVRTIPIVLNNGHEYDKIKQRLNNANNVIKVSNDIYEYKGPDSFFINFVKEFKESVFKGVNDYWFSNL